MVAERQEQGAVDKEGLPLFVQILDNVSQKYGPTSCEQLQLILKVTV